MKHLLSRILLGSCTIAIIVLAVRFLCTHINFFGPLCATVLVLAVTYGLGCFLHGDFEDNREDW